MMEGATERTGPQGKQGLGWSWAAQRVDTGLGTPAALVTRFGFSPFSPLQRGSTEVFL